MTRHIIAGVLLTACSVYSFAQTDNGPHTKKHKFALYGGIGPNYYFNNLVIGKSLVNSFNYSFTGRFMWEPGHLLSLGIESGYYRLYTLNTPDSIQAHIVNSAIPIQLVLSMKFLKTFYVNFSMGQSILLNKVNSPTYGNFDASNWSLGDFGGTIGYRHQLTERLSIAAETKYFYSTGFTDRNVAILFVCGYAF
jgi:hypothetical protein